MRSLRKEREVPEKDSGKEALKGEQEASDRSEWERGEVSLRK